MERFLDFVRAPCAGMIAVRSTAVVEFTATAPTAAATSSSSGGLEGGLAVAAAAARRPAPLLASEMVVVPDGDGVERLGYSAGPEAIGSKVMALFERGLQRLQVGGWLHTLQIHSQPDASSNLPPFLPLYPEHTLTNRMPICSTKGASRS
jgi:hypothetical protein